MNEEEAWSKYNRQLRSAGLPAIEFEDYIAQRAESARADREEHARRAREKREVAQANKHAHSPRAKREQPPAPPAGEPHKRRIGHRVAQLRSEGMSDAEIAAQLRVSVAEVCACHDGDTCQRDSVGNPVACPDHADITARNAEHAAKRASKMGRTTTEQDAPRGGNKARGQPRD